jgi:hypothetical protein
MSLVTDYLDASGVPYEELNHGRLRGRTEAVRVQTLDLFRDEHASLVPLVQNGTPLRQETASNSDRTGGDHG